MKFDSKNLDQFLMENGFDTIHKTDKEKLKDLKEIIYVCKVNRDFEELKYTQNITQETCKEYIKNLQVIDAQLIGAQNYLFQMKSFMKEKRKQKIRSFFKK